MLAVPGRQKSDGTVRSPSPPAGLGRAVCGGMSHAFWCCGDQPAGVNVIDACHMSHNDTIRLCQFMLEASDVVR
jgi:hypothetical protein